MSTLDNEKASIAVGRILNQVTRRCTAASVPSIETAQASLPSY